MLVSVGVWKCLNQQNKTAAVLAREEGALCQGADLYIRDNHTGHGVMTTQNLQHKEEPANRTRGHLMDSRGRHNCTDMN